MADAVSFLQKTYSNNMSAEFTYLEVFVLYIESTASTFRKLDHSMNVHDFKSHSPYIQGVPPVKVTTLGECSLC